MKRSFLLIVLVIALFLNGNNLFAQDKAAQDAYRYAFTEINNMLTGKAKLDFKRAVFLTENAFHDNKLSYTEFCNKIDEIEKVIIRFMKDKGVTNHPIGKQYAIFNYMMEPSIYNDSVKLTYDFEDLTGKKDYRSMFVTKLLRTKKGNCHSIPYLYKILAEELGAEAYLAIAPNHQYIKHKDDKGQWINLELTNGTFPRDAWVMSSTGTSLEAIKMGTYMAPETLQQTIARTLLDLAGGYKFRFGHSDLTHQCSERVMEYYPTCLEAYMIKYEALGESLKGTIFLRGENHPMVIQLKRNLMALGDQMDKMGYRERNKAEYEQWIKDAENEKNRQQALAKPKTTKK